MTGRGLTIGRLAAETGCNVQTIRYYERIGILPVPARSSGNQRIYRDDQIGRLRFVRRARDLGFPLETVRELLAMSDNPDRPCEEVDLLACAHREEVDRRINRLTALRDELGRMIDHSRGGRISDCRIVQALSQEPPARDRST
jgi:DNA-binding transcriptional MerR regulator